MSTQFDITMHAVERYVERYRPGLAHDQARIALEGLCAQASPLKSKSINGQSLWRVAEPPMVLVTKPDGGKVVVVTILPQHAVEQASALDGDESEEMVEAYERIRHLVENSTDKKAIETALAEFSYTAKSAFKMLKNDVESLKKVRGAIASDITKLVNRLAAVVGVGAMPDEAAKAVAAIALNKAMTESARVALGNAAGNPSEKLVSLQKKLMRQVAHAERMDQERMKMRDLLRIALRVLVPLDKVSKVRAALDEIAAVAPGVVTDDFLSLPEKKS